MRFLRGRWFVLACVLAVAVGFEIGGSGLVGWIAGPDWWSKATVRAWRTATHPPGPVRLTEMEIAERNARLRTAFGDAVPKTFAFWEVDRLNGLVVRDLGGCRAHIESGRLLPNEACDLVKLRADFNIMLTEGDPKVETIFVPREQLAMLAPVFFFLGKDGKGKILLWAANRGYTSVRVSAPGLGTALMPVGGHETLMFGDDPGPDDGVDATPTLPLSAVHADGRKEYSTLKVDGHLAQRFKYYAALKGKPYDPKEWISPKAEGQRAIKRGQ